MKRLLLPFLIAIAACSSPGLSSTAPAADQAPGVTAERNRADSSLMPRDVLFGNPDKTGPSLSPDGKQLLYRAPVDGVLNVWVGPANDPSAAKPITSDQKRGIRFAGWSWDSKHVLYIQDVGGDENWHVYAVDPAGGEARDLTPIDGVAAQFIAASPKFPDEIMVGLNERDKAQHDLYRLNLRTGKRKLVRESENFLSWVVDDNYKVRYVIKSTEDGGMEVLRPRGKKAWKTAFTVPQEDSMTTSPGGFDKSGKVMYMRDSRGRDTSALVELDTRTGKTKVIADDPRSGITAWMQGIKSKKIYAVAKDYDRQRWEVIDDSVKDDFEYLRGVADGNMFVRGQTVDERTWLVSYSIDTGPSRHYVYDRGAKKATFLFTDNSALEKLELARMHPALIKSRDGLELVSYLTLPRTSDADGDARPSEPMPMVLMVHGGPWGRDFWGYSPYHQWLASRGYAVLSVNFRGSVGFTKTFVNAGDKEWAGKMHDDLLDAVDWAIAQKIADPARVAIMGGSYGGYATLVGLTFTPEKFACGVDIVGPSNLVTLLETIPPYWKPMMATFKTRVGDHTTKEGRKLLEERSPLSRADKIVRPLLIGQGANDPRVKQAEADQIVKAMQDRDIPVTYVLYPDEGHGFARPQNRLSFNAVTEAFLSGCLGGSYQPVGKDFEGSSITVPAGADLVPGLAEALTSG